MKKTIALFLIFISVISAFSSCALKPSTNIEPYTSYIHVREVYRADYDLENEFAQFEIVSVPDEIKKYSAYITEEDSNGTIKKYYKKEWHRKTFSYNGETYTGKYNGSNDGWFFYTVSYVTDDGTHFTFKEDTDEVISFYTKDLGSLSEEAVYDDPEQWQDKADEYASFFIDDMENFVCTSEKLFNSFVYTYNRVFDGIKSMDSLGIYLTNDGEYCGFIADYLGWYKDKTINVNEEKVKESVEEKLKSAYEAKGYELVSFSLRKAKIGKTYTDEYRRIISMGDLTGVDANYDCIIKDSDGNEYSVIIAVFTTVETSESNTETNSDGNEEIDWLEIE